MSGDSSLGIGIGLALKSYGRGFRGLLNQYPGAAAAYSLRKLSGAVSNVVRVRRASDNAEQDFTAAEVDNGTLESFCGVGDGFVATWYDQSGNGNNAVQATTTSQPQIVEGGSLVTGGIDFDGVDDYFALTTTLTTQPYNTFSVYSATKTGSYIYSGSTVPIAGRRLSGTYLMTHGVVLEGGTHPATEILGTYFANGANSGIFSNGTSIASGDAGNSANIIQYIFGRPSDAFGGTAREFIIYDSDQSDNRTAIEANINAHHNIYP